MIQFRGFTLLVTVFLTTVGEPNILHGETGPMSGSMNLLITEWTNYYNHVNPSSVYLKFELFIAWNFQSPFRGGTSTESHLENWKNRLIKSSSSVLESRGRKSITNIGVVK